MLLLTAVVTAQLLQCPQTLYLSLAFNIAVPP